MRDKAVFAALASCWALGLLLCAWFLVRSVDPALLTRFATALIAAAVMLAARGVAWRRRVGYALATVGLAALLVLIGRSSVLTEFVGRGRALHNRHKGDSGRALRLFLARDARADAHPVRGPSPTVCALGGTQVPPLLPVACLRAPSSPRNRRYAGSFSHVNMDFTYSPKYWAALS